MLTRSELPRNPVALTIADGDARHTVTAERLRGNRIRIACTCHAPEGWCRHRLDLLCLRYDAVLERDDEAEFGFEDIVMGTALADLADEVDVALQDYGKAARAMETKPAGLDSGALRTLAERAADLSEAATHLDGALTRFRKKLAEGQGPQPLSSKPG